MDLFRHIPEHLAVTGRVKSWLAEVLNDGQASHRLPVSCTTFHVADRFEGDSGIIDSWKFTALALKNGAGVAIDLSSLSPNGHKRPSGVDPSGPNSFAEIYSPICHTIRRGGRKIGAVNLFLDASHPDANEFVNMPRSLLPWAKRTLYVDRDPNHYYYWPDIERAINRGDLWLAKKSYDSRGTRLFSNVCLEVLLNHRATCLLSHNNLGKLDWFNLPNAMSENMNWLCQIHPLTGVGDSGLYLSHLHDRQVGLGFVGLANLLARRGIFYWEFVEALQALKSDTGFSEESIKQVWFKLQEGQNDLGWSEAQKLALAFSFGYHSAARVAKSYGMERAFAIAPTANVSYHYQDADGYTVAPEISPPLDRIVDRDSQELGVKTYYYHPETEIASEVGWDTQFKLLCLFQDMMNSTGLAHSISANWWVDFDSNQAKKWWNSPLISTYYRLIVDQQALDKTQTRACVLNDPDCVACAE